MGPEMFLTSLFLYLYFWTVVLLIFNKPVKPEPVKLIPRSSYPYPRTRSRKREPQYVV